MYFSKRVLLIHVKVSIPYMTDEIDADPQHLLGVSIQKRGTFYFGRGGPFFQSATNWAQDSNMKIAVTQEKKNSNSSLYP